jgi:hypothetical protein
MIYAREPLEIHARPVIYGSEWPHRTSGSTHSTCLAPSSAISYCDTAAAPISGSASLRTLRSQHCRGQLLKHGLPVRLSGQPFHILLILLAYPGEVVTNEHLRKQIWKDGTFVDFEHGLHSAVNKLRRVWAIRPRIRGTSKPCPTADTDS